jgi:hypothetical protein
MGDSGKIYEAISNVMAEIGAIGKEKKNLQQGFMYRGIDDVMNALQPSLVKHKVFIVPEVTSETREEKTNKNGTLLFYVRLGITYRFFTTDGSSIETKVIGEAMDSGDKATNKAMSIAYKYACFQVFCIPTEEMRDPDAETHEPVQKAGNQKDKSTKEKADNKKTGEANAKIQPSKAPPIPTEEQMANVANQVINATKVSVIRKELERTGVSEAAICKRYEIEKLEDCTEDIFIKAMNALKKTKDKGAA